MSQAEPIPHFGDWGGSGGEPPRSYRPVALSLWASLGILWVAGLALYLGWLGVLLAAGAVAWGLVGAQLARSEEPAEKPLPARPAHRWFSFYKNEPEEPEAAGVIRLPLRRRRLSTRASNPIRN
jgi:hypothetical protein